MHKRAIEAALRELHKALNNTNWQGKFTPEIREATVVHRQEFIAKPLENAIKTIEGELSTMRSKRRKPARSPRAYRAPYND